MSNDKEIQLRKDYMNVFRTPEGIRVFEDLKGRCFEYDSTIQDGEKTEANEGRRQVLLHIKEMLSDDSIQRLSKEE